MQCHWLVIITIIALSSYFVWPPHSLDLSLTLNYGYLVWPKTILLVHHKNIISKRMIIQMRVERERERDYSKVRRGESL